MLNQKELLAIKKDLLKGERLREVTIQQSQAIIRMSKEAIYALHRGDLKKAAERMKVMSKAVKALPKCATTNVGHVAAQEYVEAATYFHILKFNKIPTRKQLGVDTYAYLGGLSDLTGELVRKAYKDIIENKHEQAMRLADVVDQIYYAFLQFDLRGGDLRRKSDQIKYNLAKLEDMRYQLALRNNK